MTTYDTFVCHTGEVTNTVGDRYRFTSAVTGAGRHVLLSVNPSVRATSVDN